MLQVNSVPYANFPRFSCLVDRQSPVFYELENSGKLTLNFWPLQRLNFEVEILGISKHVTFLKIFKERFICPGIVDELRDEWRLP